MPEPLRGSDIPSFANYSIVVRLPEIARRALADNRFSPEVVARLETLIGDIPDQPIRPVEIPLCPNARDWERFIGEVQGKDWLQIPWFFAEEYFYIRILEATRYFHSGPGQGVDPFTHQKTLGLENSLESARSLFLETKRYLANPQQKIEKLIILLGLDLAGNQNDLSLWPVGRNQLPDGAPNGLSAERLLADHSRRLSEWIFRQPLPLSQIDLVLDNAGSELVFDLCLADYLMQAGIAQKIRLHLKPHPVFVSDAMPADVHQTLAFLSKDADPASSAAAQRLQQALVSGQLELTSHFFWTSPLAMWQMPLDLYQALGEASLILFKGDANYRRLLGDRHWPFTTPWEQIVAYMPSPVAALRASKSEVAAGLQPGQIERVATVDPNWLTDGQWAFIQFNQ